MSIPNPKPTLINIGSHSLALYSHGPEPSTKKDPVVLFVSGVSSSSLVWAAVIRQLPSSLRSYTYDRSGFGKSELSPLAPTAENVAIELSQLIHNAPIENPLIIVGHSWAGVLVREFVALAGNDTHIAGVVLVDANHENTLQVLNVVDPDLEAIFVGVDQFSATGDTAEHKLTQEDWNALVTDEATKKFKLQEQNEDAEYGPSFATLQKKELEKRRPLLGDIPVYVIGGMRSRDWKGQYKVGVEKGNGTEEQRSHAREMIRTANEKNEIVMKEHLSLSTKGELVYARESGHFVQLTQPNVVVDGINWVLVN